MRAPAVGRGINILADGLSIVLLQMIWHTKGKSTIVAGLERFRCLF
jgi:ABC-type uncharacterized transport system permease subunit